MNVDARAEDRRDALGRDAEREHAVAVIGILHQDQLPRAVEQQAKQRAQIGRNSIALALPEVKV